MKAVLVALVAVCAFLLVACGAGRHMIDPDDTPLVEASGRMLFEKPVPDFSITALSVPSDDARLTKILIMVAVDRDELIFTKYGDSLRAEIVIDATIISATKNQKRRATSIQKEFITVSGNKETKEGTHVSHIYFYATPGIHCAFVVGLEDKNRKAETYKRCDTGSRRIADSFQISDPIIFSRVMIKDGAIGVSPYTAPYINPWEPIAFLTTIYFPPTPILFIQYAIIGKEHKTLLEGVDSVLYVYGNWACAITKFMLPPDMENGRYTFAATVFNKEGAGTITTSREFNVYSLIPRAPVKIDEMANQMLHMPNAEQLIKEVRAAESAESKRELIIAFWHDAYRDSEKAWKFMGEYMRRVRYANKHFAPHKKIPGWRTDRGATYIKFGPPTDVVREYFPANGVPYEMWFYYGLRAEDRRLFYKQFKFFKAGIDYTYGFDEWRIHNETELNNAPIHLTVGE